MSDRQTAMRDFLVASGWGDASVTPLPGDASTRRYARLVRGGESHMLMDQPQGAETPTAPPDASEAERQALGYNAVARLAGADCARFAAVAAYLREHGLAAPQVLAADHAQGFAVLEDLGDALFTDVLAQGGDERRCTRQRSRCWRASMPRMRRPSFLPTSRCLPMTRPR